MLGFSFMLHAEMTKITTNQISACLSKKTTADNNSTMNFELGTNIALNKKENTEHLYIHSCTKEGNVDVLSLYSKCVGISSFPYYIVEFLFFLFYKSGKCTAQSIGKNI